MKLLVPIDGSSASVNAVKKSIEIARKHDFSIKIVSVVDPSPLNFDDELQGKLIEYRNRLLNSIVERLDFSGIDIKTELLVGEPHIEILKAARDEKVDLIVIGNRGFSKIKRFFLGSVAQRVISEAPCPVLVIHTDVDF